MEKKDLFSKSLLGLSVVGIIAASCSSDGLWTESDENSEYLNSLSDEGKAALSINLTQDEIEYLNFLNKLAQDVIKEPAVARQFACDPNAFIQQYGYKGEVNLDEGMLKLILTLGDDDINTAINQNDITTALALMQSKGLLDDISKSDTQIKFSVKDVEFYDLFQLCFTNIVQKLWIVLLNYVYNLFRLVRNILVSCNE